MGRALRLSVVGFGLLVAGLAAFVIHTIWFTPLFIEHFYARVFVEYALSRPMLLSTLRILEPYGLEFHSDDLDDFSVEFTLDSADRVDRNLKILRSYDRETQSASQRLSTDILDWFLAAQAARRPYLFHDYPLNQLDGVQSALPDFMLTTHQVRTLRDARNYVARLSRFGVALDQTLEGVRTRAERGIVPPRFVVQRVRHEIDGFLGSPPDQNVLYAEFAERLEKIEDLGVERREKLLEATHGQIRDTVYPAYERLATYLPELEGVATDEDGVWKLPRGEDFYAWALRWHTTTDMSSDQIHRVGLAEVERIQTAMRRILDAEGYPTDDLGATLQAVHRERRFLYPETESGRARILEDYRGIIDDVTPRLPSYFGRIPGAPVVVERVPEFKEAGAPGAYYRPPALDGSRPGIFFANLRSVEETPRFGMRTLAFHEAIPGHHLQIAIALESEGIPFFRRVIPFTAFTVGGRGGVSPDAVRPARSARGRGVPRRAPCGRYGDPRETLDAGEGDRLHGAKHRNAGDRRDCGDRALHRESRSGLRLQGGSAQDPGASQSSTLRPRRAVRLSGVPRRGSRKRGAPADDPRTGGRGLDRRGVRGMTAPRESGSSSREAVLVERLRRHRFIKPLASQKDYPSLFRLLQPVSTGADDRPGSPPRLLHRTAFDDAREADRLRARRVIVKGRFLGGRIGYVHADDLALYANAFWKPLPRPTHVQSTVLEAVRAAGPLSARQLKEETELLNKQIMPALHRLQEAFLVYEDQTDAEWDRAWYDFESEWPSVTLDESSRDDSASRAFLHFLKGHVFATASQLRDWSGLPSRTVSRLVKQLEESAEVIPLEVEGLGAGWCCRNDRIPDATTVPESVLMLDRADPLARSHVSELKTRFGGHDILRYLLIDGVFRGAVLGRWGFRPYDVEDIVLELPSQERARRRVEVIDAVARVYHPPRHQIRKYAGRSLPRGSSR
jgi:uncharacterized protein (DUF885 family)